ncbi:MAG: hypothetical protein EWV48_18590 [Microcystis aeruginosa Ma_QC_C_20070823_S13]|jgi:hypothetical protein|nr:hypothetical protein [Microcystis aeruginosa W13-18]NCR37297.1 hypothetical protein [Microcystis aeruginosa S11-05]NCR50360.1 hypothetical protein [Microcystis aeruginosa S11-01]NCS07461.1 hypothetical protein [Microcystis aeruginosa G13-07]NCS78629.1 hypothetical protein [Microcystis aeruginosa K13-07]TRU57467.1 MAG: hypothetical protein EWV48_18590 [Microcystis aeruginosa Ma_QC_C_20070823_S13]TRU59120.1 MAG: hypothetical protein EWV56_13040 [Microcystis aeruginosa Ma_QC_C_20070823_S13D]
MAKIHISDLKVNSFQESLETAINRALETRNIQGGFAQALLKPPTILGKMIRPPLIAGFIYQPSLPSLSNIKQGPIL